MRGLSPTFSERAAAGTVLMDDCPTLMDDGPTRAPDSSASDTTGGGTASTPGQDGSSDTGPLALGQDFSKRYHIIRLLGIGGMGAVYQASDAELGVAVAVKVIRPEVMADPVAAKEVERRFK